MARKGCEFNAHCGNYVGPESQTGLCHQCYSALYYWQDKTIKRKMKRMKVLEKCHARMEYITGVTSVTAKRRRRHSRAA